MRTYIGTFLLLKNNLVQTKNPPLTATKGSIHLRAPFSRYHAYVHTFYLIRRSGTITHNQKLKLILIVNLHVYMYRMSLQDINKA